jgi:hypothetical protein
MWLLTFKILIKMMNIAGEKVFNKLDKARELTLPSRSDMLIRSASVNQFWHQNKDLLVDAWQEWEESEIESVGLLGSRLLAPSLREAVEAAWDDPSKEFAVRELWKEVSSGVYTCQFFDPERLIELRTYLEKAWDAKIPMRPPYGIVLNRSGAMLDKRSPGYLAAPSFQDFYNQLINFYMRPIARLLFPEVMGFDSQSFGFSINYQPNTDTSIRPHTDASAVTLNINLNLPGESFTGSSVDFVDLQTGKTNSLSFTPGSAMIHRGNIPHAALPITSGERTNIVLWLYGKSGQIPNQLGTETGLPAEQRWVSEKHEQDLFAPF